MILKSDWSAQFGHQLLGLKPGPRFKRWSVQFWVWLLHHVDYLTLSTIKMYQLKPDIHLHTLLFITSSSFQCFIEIPQRFMRWSFPLLIIKSDNLPILNLFNRIYDWFPWGVIHALLMNHMSINSVFTMWCYAQRKEESSHTKSSKVLAALLLPYSPIVTPLK